MKIDRQYKPKTRQPEKDIEQKIIEYLRFLNFLAFKVESQGRVIGNKRVPMTKYHQKGCGDIFCAKNGKATFLEVKTITGKQGDLQKEFELQCNAAKIGYFVVRSVVEVADLYEKNEI